MRRGVLLSGDHPTLPEAELRALCAVHDPGARVLVDGLVGSIDPAAATALDAGLGRMALAASWGVLWGETLQGPGAAAELARATAIHADGRGTAGVHFERRGARKNPDARALQRAVGDALRQCGHTIDLAAPERRIFLWLVEERILVGERLGAPAPRYGERAVEKRMHFSPVSLHPRRAATLLHLVRVPPGQRVYDPFCGTGGIVLEAALEGYDAWGSDLDAFMVQGTLQALADVGPEPLAGTVFEADIADAAGLAPEVAGIVTDLPYGRASTTGGEGLRPLYARAFRAFHDLLPTGGRAVAGLADPALLDLAAPAGLVVEEVHRERMHRSLTRHFAVLRRAHEAPPLNGTAESAPQA